MPFRRTRIVISAMIVGCMAPDFEYFLHAGMFGRESHNVRGAFVFALPVSLIVLVLFHQILKKPLSALLPRNVQERIVFADFRFWPVSRLVMIVFSILLGIASHLLWDSFTHPQGRAVIAMPWLREGVIILGRPMQYFKVAQHLSTILGLVLLAIWFLHWYRSEPRQSAPEYLLSTPAKVGSICLILLVGALLGIWRAQMLVAASPVSLGRFVANAVVAFLSTVCVELLLFSVALRLRMGRDGVEEI